MHCVYDSGGLTYPPWCYAHDRAHAICLRVDSTATLVLMERLTTPDGQRVETGPLKIDDDWCGFFVRGDDALLSLFPILMRAKEGTLTKLDRVAAGTWAERISECRE